MPTVEPQRRVERTESERMELRSLVNLASEPVSHFWPMATFIHHNPLHGLEHLPFERAIEEGSKFRGGKGYLTNEEYRGYHREGRISSESITEALAPLAQHTLVPIGDRKISHLEALRTVLVNGTGKVPADVGSAILQESLNEPCVNELVEKLRDFSHTKQDHHFLRNHIQQEQETLGSLYTLADWCDRTLGTQIQTQVNHELIKWCGGFFDEGHAPWPMPLRNKTFYGGWRMLAQDDFSGPLLGIKEWKTKLKDLPARPEDAILESLQQLKIPKHL